MTLVIVFVIGAGIAFANGANDISKGIATLVGSGVTQYRRALLWGTAWTGVGALAGAFLAQAMVSTFGKGLLTPSAQPTIAAALATISGAALWITISTWKGLPVSTTHAIVGAIIGVGYLAYGPNGVNWASLGNKIILPLLLSPIVALALTLIVVRLIKVFASGGSDCVCVAVDSPVAVGPMGAAMVDSAAIARVGITTCVAAEKSVSGITVNHLHWLTSGAASLSRGLNDTPKMVALVVAAAFLSPHSRVPLFAYFFVVAAGIVLGSWLGGRRVTDVLACGVTRMDHREGFIANLITAALVGPGAVLGLPMSITHVSSGAIMGIAAGRDSAANLKTIRHMLFAWIVTLPVAATLGIAVLMVLRMAGVK